MKEQDFDKLIGGKLRDYSQQPPEEFFSRIEKSLAEGGAGIPATAAKRRRLAPVWRYAGVAALLCALLATSLYLRNTYRTEPEAIMANADTTETTATTQEEPSVISTPEAEESPSVSAGNTTPKKNISPRRLAGNTVSEVKGLPESTNATTDESSQQAETTVQDSRRKPRRPYNPNARQNIDQYWDNLLAAETPKKHSNKASFSIFAGNIGTGSGESTNNPDKAVAYGMLLKEQPGNAGKPAGVLMDGGNIQNSASSFETNTQDISLKHYMPLNVGLGVSIPLSEDIAINTGLNYTYLFSSSKQAFTAGVEGRTTRELHYLGIPVGLSYKFFSKKGFNIYVYGGGAIEKAVGWRETYSFSNSVDNGKEIVNRNVKGVQLSVNASAGVSYDIAKSVSLYLEPGVAYYFHQKDQPASYRTAHPTSFSLRLGFRFGI